VAAQAYLHTTQPNPGDPGEHMHRAALNGLKRRHIATKEPISQDHHVVTIVLGTGAAVDDLEHHNQGDTKSQSIEEPKDPGLQTRRTIMKTTKRRWGHHALPTGFAPCQYPKVSNYPMISKSTMDPRSHSHGSRIICKQ
jgi:hypothetical protein